MNGMKHCNRIFQVPSKANVAFSLKAEPMIGFQMFDSVKTLYCNVHTAVPRSSPSSKHFIFL